MKTRRPNRPLALLIASIALVSTACGSDDAEPAGAQLPTPDSVDTSDASAADDAEAPLATLPAPPSGPGTEAGFYEDNLGAALVGRPLDEAVSDLEAAGWTVETIDADDPDEMVGAEILPTRAQVIHRDGLVTAIQVDPWP